MMLTFWQQVSQNWQLVQKDATMTAVDLSQFISLLLQDLESVQEQDVETEIFLELENDDDFWGGL